MGEKVVTGAATWHLPDGREGEPGALRVAGRAGNWGWGVSVE